jgi:decaprenyl-phosphate phosphoribosyltransferase
VSDSAARALVVAMRPRQWIKNLLVFAAPLAAGSLGSVSVLVPSLMAFVSFVLASSSTYLLNDVVDVQADRQHPTKAFRPIAAGRVSPRGALILAVVLAILSVVVAAAASWGLVLVVIAYLIITCTYSIRLKHEPVIELVMLSSGFLLRAIAGGVAAGLYLSPWFLLVTGFGSLAVAAGKRYAELLGERGDTATPVRKSLTGYTDSYLRFVWSLAAAVTVTTYCLWAVEVGQPSATAPWALLSIVPFVLAVLRFGVDVDAARTQAPEDVVLRDPFLLAMGLAWAALFAAGAAGL